MAEQVLDAKAEAGSKEFAALKLLERLDGFRVEQKVELIEVVTCNCWERPNEYIVFDKDGKVKLFNVTEKTSCCMRQCCGEHRPFTLKVYDHTGKKDKKIMTIKRGFHCPCPYVLPLPCCGNSIRVHYMVDDEGNEISRESSATLMSHVYLPLCGGFCIPTLNISDARGKVAATVKGPFCCVTDCCGADFSLNDPQGKPIGEIKKYGASSLKDITRELVSDADMYGVSFPADLNPAVKMAVLAALLQIDFIFFEDQRSPREGRCCDLWCCGCPLACMPAWLCCCLYTSKEAREKAKKNKKGAPEADEMER